MFEELREKLEEKIAELAKSGDAEANGKLEAILEKSSELMNIPSLRPVTMCLFKHLPEVGALYKEVAVTKYYLFAVLK